MSTFGDRIKDWVYNHSPGVVKDWMHPWPEATHQKTMAEINEKFGGDMAAWHQAQAKPGVIYEADGDFYAVQHPSVGYVAGFDKRYKAEEHLKELELDSRLEKGDWERVVDDTRYSAAVAQSDDGYHARVLVEDLSGIRLRSDYTGPYADREEAWSHAINQAAFQARYAHLESWNDFNVGVKSAHADLRETRQIDAQPHQSDRLEAWSNLNGATGADWENAKRNAEKIDYSALSFPRRQTPDEQVAERLIQSRHAAELIKTIDGMQDKHPADQQNRRALLDLIKENVSQARDIRVHQRSLERYYDSPDRGISR